MGRVELFLAAFGALVALSLIAGVRLYVVNGNSMFPDIKNGDCVLVAPLLSPECGDVVVYERSGELVVHRVVKVLNGSVVTKGDNLSEVDGKTDMDKIRGVVVMIVPGGRFTLAIFQAFCTCSMVLGIYAVTRLAIRRW